MSPTVLIRCFHFDELLSNRPLVCKEVLKASQKKHLLCYCQDANWPTSPEKAEDVPAKPLFVFQRGMENSGLWSDGSVNQTLSNWLEVDWRKY
jgi:hypothetical protein